MAMQETPILRAEDELVLSRLKAAMGSKGKQRAIEKTQAWSGDDKERLQTHKLKKYWEGYHLLGYMTHLRDSLEEPASSRLMKHIKMHISDNGFSAIQSFPSSKKTVGISAVRVSSILKVAGGFGDHALCKDEDHGQHCSATDFTECKYSLLMGILGYMEYCRDHKLPIEQFSNHCPDHENASTEYEDLHIPRYSNGEALDQTIDSVRTFLASRNSPVGNKIKGENALDNTLKNSLETSALKDSSASQPKQMLMRTKPRVVLAALLLMFFCSAAWLANQSSSADLEYQHALRAVDSKNYAKAIALLKSILNEHGNYIDAYYLLAEIYTNLADTETAIRYYREGIENDPIKRPQAYNNLALLLLAQHQASDALVLLDQAELKISAQTPLEQWAQKGIIYKNRAWAYWALGSKAQALKPIENAQKFLSSAQKLDQFPEVFCLQALIEPSQKPFSGAAQECIKRFEKLQKHAIADAGGMLNPPSGVSYDLYLQVLKQESQKPAI